MGMRSLTKKDINAIIGTVQKGYTIKQAKIRRGRYSDSDHYGILLGVNADGKWVTWQFHLDNEELSIYWGHYIENADDAFADFNARD